MHHLYPGLVVSVPDWVCDLVDAAPSSLRTPEERMRLAISLARESAAHGGGPFGALVVEDASGRVVAPGVNLVVPLSCSLAHAETVAISIAQQATGSYDLGSPGLPAMQLVTSTEPCAMCLGAIPWSGVKSIACGATGDDAEKVGFDEGAKPDRWAEALEERGIHVTCGVCREEAAAVLLDYAKGGGLIYNGGEGATGSATAGRQAGRRRRP
jgi:tRNA(Arg) A34 adenosine deaminase TadA